MNKELQNSKGTQRGQSGFRVSIIIIALAGMVVAGCNSNSKTENLTDSGLVDTIMPVDSVVVDTTPLADTALVEM